MNGSGAGAVLDRTRLAAISGGSAVLERELIGALVDEATALVGGLQAAAAASDTVRAAELAHALKGIAGNVGAPRLEHAAAALEHCGEPALRAAVERAAGEVAALAALR